MTDTITTQTEDGAEGFMVDALANLPEKTLIDEKRLAKLILKHPKTVQRMIVRGELPPPTDFAKHRVWLVGHILEHVKKSLHLAAMKAEREAARIAKFSP